MPTKLLVPTFENLLRLAEGVAAPRTDNERTVHWCDEARIVGISRQRGGGYEIFLCGEELRASLPLVRRHLVFDQWVHAGGEPFWANRLVLPPDEHYLPVVAFLTEELFRRDITRLLRDGFSQTERLIEMALRRVALSEEEVLGLLGELRFLEVLLSVVEQDTRGYESVLNSWCGYKHGARDFVVGNRSIEVKATHSERSVHRISNVMQVDPRRSPSNSPSEELFLVSLGFQLVEDESVSALGLSLPTQIDALLKKLPPPTDQQRYGDLQSMLLTQIAAYGGGIGRGYDHDVMRGWAAYQTRWWHGFVRIYDMRDDAIQVLRRADVERRSHVVLESVSFQVDLPERVSGDLNPVSDLFALAKRFLA